MSADRLEVMFDQTLDDLVALSRFLVRESPASLRPRWVIRLAYPVLTLGAVLIWLSMAPVDWVILGVILVAAAIFTTLLWNRYDQAAEEHARSHYGGGRSAALLGPVRLIVSEQGIERITQFSEARVQWAAVERIATDGDHLFLFLGPATAYIVPRRAFAGECEFQDFLERARVFQAGASGRLNCQTC